MSFFLNPALACDYYKIGHPFMQPPGTQTVYSTWTARSYKHHLGCPKTVVFGHQYTIKEFLIDFFQKNFFDVSIDVLRDEYQSMIQDSFNPRYIGFDRFEELHQLGYLPLSIYGVPEGTLLPVGIPDHVVFNTHPNFAWLPQYIEDIWSANNWLPSTSATTAYYLRRQIEPYCEKTSDISDLAQHMCGDFSLRGHTSLQAGAISGAAHLLSFDRTATVLSNALVKQFYGDEVAGLGTPSLEHSVVEQGVAWFRNRIATGDIPDYIQPYLQKVMLKGDWEVNLVAEMCFILYLLTEVQPTGTITYVSDTYDYWGVVSCILPTIKEAIMVRDGCFSVRPDSGNPVSIICGDKYVTAESPVYKGTLSCLLDIFGYEVNGKGYKVLPPQIRMIYGDAITKEIVDKVGAWCVSNKVSIENVTFGIGAFTYQYVTRDTRGYAIKATDCIHEKYGEIPIFKAPKIDPNKKSLRGCVAVVKDADEQYRIVDGLTLDESLAYEGNIMVPKLVNGEIKYHETLWDIKQRLQEEKEHD